MIFTSLETEYVRRLHNGHPDANGQMPEATISDGEGNPCRHCLEEIPAGAGMLVLAFRPFDTLHPYAETGPIFLCAAPCRRGGGTAELPTILTTSPDYLLRGYNGRERIVYGTGAVVQQPVLTDAIAHLFQDDRVAFAHIRSSRNNCYQLRVDRA